MSALTQTEGAVRGGPRDVAALDVVSVAREILEQVGPRAITLLTTPRRLDDGRVLPPRLSANDCYVALPDACRKMARVVVVRRRAMQRVGNYATLAELFPDPVAYLARAIRSVISDEGRALRREPLPLSLDAPLALDHGSAVLSLADTVEEQDREHLPEDRLIDREDRKEFRTALAKALQSVPANYRAALARDIQRERARQAGEAVPPATDAERQTLCRARAAVAAVLQKECTADNPFLWMLARQRASKVARRSQPSAKWTGERQSALVRRLLEAGWAGRRPEQHHDAVAEAVVNDVTEPGTVAPPSPEVRQAVRVLDLFTVDRNSPATEPARSLYDEARKLRAEGKIEEALAQYRACYEAEPQFIEALNEVGVMYSQLGRLREALQVYLTIIDLDPHGPHRHIAATNAADIYLTWFDAGRNRERNIALARKYAEMAMERPSPMRACNLVLALVKDRLYLEARDVLERIIREDRPECRAQRFLETMFQIRDPDLVRWWTWLEEALGKEQQS